MQSFVIDHSQTNTQCFSECNFPVSLQMPLGNQHCSKPQALQSKRVKDQSVKNPELSSPFKPGSEYSHACFTYCLGFLLRTNASLFHPSGPFPCIFSKTSPIFPALAEANTSSSVGPQSETGHPACCSR